MNVYLDYAATSPLDEEVLAAMLPALGETFGNPHSLHSFGRRADCMLGDARDLIASVLGVQPREVYFTSGGTEADNWAVRGIACGGEKSGVCLSAIEHAAAQGALEHGMRRGERCPVGEDGIVTPRLLQAALDRAPQTALACVMAVNNETGCIQPVEELAALCRARGVLFFSDCVQAALTQDMKRIAACCDAFSLSAHKLYGPKGAGALVVKRGVPLSPLVAGGEQERGLRGGTVNVAGAVGLACALEKAQREREAFCAQTGMLRDAFETLVLQGLGGRVAIDGVNRVPNISHMTFDEGSEALLHRLDLAGVACSGGAACSAHSAQPSHVMLAMGRGEAARRGIRFSFGRHTTMKEVRFAVRALLSCLSALQ